MPDILIRGVDIPQDCGDCYLCHDMFCFALKKLRSNKDYRERPDNCPLLELPEHGDLIDRDALVYAARVAEEGIAFSALEVEDMANRLPVIVPAERREDGN